MFHGCAVAHAHGVEDVPLRHLGSSLDAVGHLVVVHRFKGDDFIRLSRLSRPLVLHAVLEGLAGTLVLALPRRQIEL